MSRSVNRGARGGMTRKEHYEYRKSSGLCTACGVKSKKTLCDNCTGRQRRRMERRLKNGLCANCDNRHLEGKTRCEYHLFEHRLRQLYRRGLDKSVDVYTTLEMLKKQENRCAICGQPLGLVEPPHVDHDHDSGKLRGLLCGTCNSGLGFFRDNEYLMRKAADYVEKHRE